MVNGSRRSHTKSKNGCRQCKRRHVKCNLQAPVCFNCWKRDEWCDYQSLGPAPRSYPYAVSDRQEATSSNISAFQVARTHTPQTGFVGSSGVYVWPIDEHLTLHRQLQDPVFGSSQNMELMKNFVERTSLEIDLVIDSDSIWQREAVQTSVGFPFLQHALMALSGLHIFHTNPLHSLSYYSSACWHSTRASELFRASVVNVDRSNWQPVLTFLIASVIFNMDILFLDQTIDYSNYTSSPASILRIMRYPGLLSRQLISRLVSGSLATTLIRRRHLFRIPVDKEVISAIKNLAQFCTAELRSGVDAETYVEAIKSLELWAESVSCQPQSWHGLVDWPVTISGRYIQLLEIRDELAAVIFCYWCAVMNRAPKRYYLVGIMKKLVKIATAGIHSKWEDLLQWPREELQ